MKSRRQARECVLQALYQCDTLRDWSEDCVLLYYREFVGEDTGVARTDNEIFSSDLAYGVVRNLSEVDALITGASENWSLRRMSRVDRNILRLGAFELCFVDDIPSSVSINEAIEIAKRFGSDDSPVFINGAVSYTHLRAHET